MLDRSCKTCEFNFNGICASENYGEKIIDFSIQRECWELGSLYHDELIAKLPVQMRKAYNNFDISIDEVIVYFKGLDKDD